MHSHPSYPNITTVIHSYEYSRSDKNSSRERLNYERRAVAELTAEVSKSGNCLCEVVYPGDAKHIIKHSWWLHILGVTLTTTLLVDSKNHRAKNPTRKVHVELIGEH